MNIIIILNALVLIINFFHFSQTEDLSELPNGLIMMKEYLFCDDDDFFLANLDNGKVTMNQYYVAMQNRAYKYLYLLSYYFHHIVIFYDVDVVINSIDTCYNIIVEYMNHHNIPSIAHLKEKLPQRNKRGMTLLRDVQKSLMEFMTSISRLFVFYHKNTKSFESVKDNDILKKKFYTNVNSGLLFKGILKKGLDFPFNNNNEFIQLNQYFDATFIIIEVISEEYRLTNLLELPNGLIMMKEYLFCDKDDFCLSDINKGKVTKQQYYVAMQNRAYKYLYLLSFYYKVIVSKGKIKILIKNIHDCLKIVINYMKHHNVPISDLEEQLPQFNDPSCIYLVDVQTLIMNFMISIMDLFVFYDISNKIFKKANVDENLKEILCENIESGLLFKGILKKGLDFPFNNNNEFIQLNQYFNATLIIIEAISEEYRLTNLLELPNGLIMMKEYLFCDKDDFCLSDINKGKVTKQQYYMAMQNRAYKYLYLLAYYYNVIVSLGDIKIMKENIHECLKIIINYMKHHNVPISDLEKQLPQFNDPSCIYGVDVQTLIMNFMTSIMDLFVYYDNDTKSFKKANVNENLKEILCANIKSGLLFKGIFKDGLVFPFDNNKNTINYNYNFDRVCEMNKNAAIIIIQDIQNEYKIK
ncbi:uncharacterized protein LOC126898710 [Daktulosphaira vitifoliae]|uniref:uncharacterized protein LOC126898710 n=1 Tax=Daktulosphaira vitifoliae TaxID=58002 RepID=UPI0021AA4AEA|nr:uncharacterized protein LOC126898710 [Daktulosphaira vitifoliae]